MNVFLTVHPLADTDMEVFTRIATPLVEHKLGWHGLTVVASKHEADSVVMLTPGRVMRDMFPEFAETRLSVCNMDTREIWVNEDRWMHVVSDASRLPLPAYRAYILHHELGHALGFGHAQPHTGPAPVMVQQTLGIGMCTPNPFPIKEEHEALRNAHLK